MSGDGGRQKGRDIFGTDLPTYQPQLTDLNDLARLRDINPMVMPTKVAGSEDLVVEELQDAPGGGEQMLGALGMTYLTMSTSAALAALGSSVMQTRGRLTGMPWPVRKTLIVSATGKAAKRYGVAGAHFLISFAALNSALAQARGKDDPLHYPFTAAASVLVMSRTANIRRYKTAFLLGCVVFGMMWSERWMERNPDFWNTVGPYWRRIRLGTLLGWQNTTTDPLTDTKQ